MRVVRAYAFDDWRVEQEPVPSPGPGELLCRLRLCGACTGEAMPWYVNRKAPVVLGHELVADVVAVGDGVADFVPGDRVFPHHHAACGVCDSCQRGLESSCALFRATALRPGGYAEYFVVPEPNVRLDTLRVPDDIPDERAIFIEPLACCLRAVDRAQPQARDRVLVIGAGVMGLLNLLLCRVRPHAQLDSADLLPERRAVAQRCGAERVFDPAEPLPHERYDIVVVCPSSSRAIELGLALAAPGARVVLFAPPGPDDRREVDWGSLYFREITIRSAYSCGPGETQQALALLRNGCIVPEQIITERAGLAQVGAVLRRIAAQEPTLLKAVIDPTLG